MKKHIDFTLLLTIIFLAIFGVICVYSASNIVAEYRYNDEFYFFKRQLLFLIIGFIGMYIVSRIDLDKIKKYTSYIFYFVFILLILVLIPGIGKVAGGARSWIGIGVFSIQPAEFMKIALINGSPKCKESASGALIADFLACAYEKCDCVEIKMNKPKLTDDVVGHIV